MTIIVTDGLFILKKEVLLYKKQLVYIKKRAASGLINNRIVTYIKKIMHM